MIARKSLLIVLNNVIGGVLGFVALFFIAREMGAEDVGILGFGLSFVGMFTFISNLGFDTAHNKRVSEGRDIGECLGTYVYFKLRLTGIMAVVSLVAILLYEFVFDLFESSRELQVAVIFLLYYVIWAFSLIAITTFNAQRKQAMAQIPSIVEFLIRTPLVILVAILLADIVYVAAVYVVGIGALLLLSLWFMRELPIRKPDPELTRSYTAFATPMAVISFTTTLSLYLDKVMIQSLSGTEEVGIYFGAQRIVIFLINTAAPLAVLLFPTISQLHSQGRIAEIRDMITTAERYLAMTVFPGVAFMAALSVPIIGIFGDDFTGAAPAWTLAFLALYSFLFILNKPVGQIISGTGRPDISVRIALSILGLNIVLNLLFIPGWDVLRFEVEGQNLMVGAVGAALSTLIAALVRFYLVRHVAKELVGYRFRPDIMFRFFAAALLAGVAVYFLYDFAGIDSAFMVIPVGLTGAALYLGLLLCMGQFTRTDYHFFMDLLHPGKMKEYVHGEITGKDAELRDEE